MNRAYNRKRRKHRKNQSVKRTEKPIHDTTEKKTRKMTRVLSKRDSVETIDINSGATTVLDIISPTTVDTKSRDYIVVDGIFHTYLYVTGYGYSTTVGTAWLAPLIEAGEGISISFTAVRQPKEKVLAKISQTTMVNRSRMRDVGDTRQDYEELDSAISSGLYLKDVLKK